MLHLRATICIFYFSDDEIDEEDEKVDWILDTIKNPKNLEKYMPNGNQEEINVSNVPLILISLLPLDIRVLCCY